MANSSTVVSGNSVFGLKDYGSQIIQTLWNSNPLIAVLGLRNNNKAQSLYNPGTPEAGALISGAQIPTATQKEIMECESYSPLLEAVIQNDIQTQTYRPNSPTLAVGSGATFSVTVTNGVITSVSVTNGGSGYAGALPTLIPVDSVNGGQGAYLVPTVSGGQVTAVTVRAGGYGYTAVEILCQTGNTAGTKNIRPTFKWTNKTASCYVYKRDKDRLMALAQGQQDLLNTFSLELQGTEITRKTSGLMQQLELDTLFSPGPTDQTDAIWDNQFSIATAIDNSSNYAGLDRALTANYFWRAQKVTTALTMTLSQLYDDMMYTRGLSFNGEGPDVIVVGPRLFSKYKQEALAYQQNANNDVNLQAFRRQFGFKLQVIMYDSVYVVCDMNLPSTYAYGLNTKAWYFATKSGANFSAQGWEDQSKIEGGKVAWYNVINFQYMLMLLAPGYGNIQYTNLS